MKVYEASAPADERRCVDTLGAAMPLRVCHVIGALRYGGAERQVVNLLNHLPYPQRYLLLLEARQDDGLRAALNARVTVGVVPVRLRNWPLGVYRVAAQLRRWRIDIVHSHMFWPNLAAAVACSLAGVPVLVTSEHGQNLDKRRWQRWAERRLITPAAALRVCVSEDIMRLRAEVDGVAPSKLCHIPNGTDCPDQPASGGGPIPVIGSVGRMVAAKDFPCLLRAAALLRQRGMEFRLRLVGDGPLRAELERTARDLGLTPWVEFAGYQSNVSAWLRRFDLFVLSSIHEGQPVALLEAMAHGLPVVATRVGGIPRTVRDGEEGLLVEPGRPDMLADAIQCLLLDRSWRQRLGEAARRRVQRDFSIAAVSARYQQLYRQLWLQARAAGRQAEAV